MIYHNDAAYEIKEQTDYSGCKHLQNSKRLHITRAGPLGRSWIVKCSQADVRLEFLKKQWDGWAISKDDPSTVWRVTSEARATVCSLHILRKDGKYTYPFWQFRSRCWLDMPKNASKAAQEVPKEWEKKEVKSIIWRTSCSLCQDRNRKQYCKRKKTTPPPLALLFVCCKHLRQDVRFNATLCISYYCNPLMASFTLFCMRSTTL